MIGIGLAQTNPTPNSEGKYLDLVFTSNANMVTVQTPDESEFLDRESKYHRPIEIVFASGHHTNIDSEKNKQYSNVSYSNLSLELGEINFQELLFANGQIDESAPEILEKTLATLQLKHTKITTFKIHPENSNHPWTRNKRYKSVYKLKRMSSRQHRKFNSIISNINLREANKNLALVMN